MQKVYHTFRPLTSYFARFLKKIARKKGACGKIYKYCERARRAIDFFSRILYNKICMENIVLIGMPSSGKSTAGVILAKFIGFGFIDCDLLIQNEEKALLCEILEREGAEGFIRIEEKINATLWAKRCVIATGGSVVYSEKAMAHLKELGKIVYLQISEEEVERRIKNFDSRGVVMRGNVTTLKELYRQRASLYERYADVILNCDGLTIDDTVEKLVAIAKGEA